MYCHLLGCLFLKFCDWFSLHFMIVSGIAVCYMRIHVLTSEFFYALCINVLFVVPICCGVCTFVLLGAKVMFWSYVQALKSA